MVIFLLCCSIFHNTHINHAKIKLYSENNLPQANEETLQARERILEAAGDLAAVLESSVQNIDAMPGTSKTDLEVITEEKEAKTDADVGESDTDDMKETPDLDPLGITIASFPDKDFLDSLDASPPEKSTEKVTDDDSKVDEFQMLSVADQGVSLVSIDDPATEEISEDLTAEGKQDPLKSDESTDITVVPKDDDSSSESSLEDGKKDDEKTMDVQGFVPFEDFSFDN